MQSVTHFGCAVSRRYLISAALAVLLMLPASSPALSIPQSPHAPAGIQVPAIHMMLSSAPGIGRSFSRVKTRAEHSGERLFDALGQAGALWLWIALSLVEFLAVAAFTSVADFRMFELRHEGRGALSRYMAYGIRTFFRVLRDHRTPWLARGVIFSALLYWILPRDLFPDHTIAPGLIDDLIITVVATKIFLRLCPDTLVAKHAAEVEAQAHAHA